MARKLNPILQTELRKCYTQFLEWLVRELGDVLWYVANIASEINRNLSEIAEVNLQKLEDRKNRGKLQGSGDNR